MKAVCVILVFLAVGTAFAAPGANSEDDSKIELFSGVAIEKDPSGEDRLNVKFAPGELRDAARTFEEARGKIKKYSPLLAGLGVKVIAILAILFGGLTLLVTKALVVAKLAFIAVAALGIQKLLSSGSLNGISGKVEPSAAWNRHWIPIFTSAVVFSNSSSWYVPLREIFKPGSRWRRAGI